VQRPLSVAARFKAYVCGLSLTVIAGSNPAGEWISVCCDSCDCCQIDVSAKGRSLVERSRTGVVCLCVTSIPQQ
jgi:hypothetical protein